VIADDNFRRQLGARFGTSAGITADGRNIGVSGSASQANSIARGTVPTGFSAGDLNVNLPVGAAGTLGLTFLNLGNGNVVNLELSALEADNRGKVVSNPRIVTADKRKATITQGTEIGFQTQASSGGTTTQFKPAVLSLDVTPQITPDDKVIMKRQNVMRRRSYSYSSRRASSRNSCRFVERLINRPLRRGAKSAPLCFLDR